VWNNGKAAARDVKGRLVVLMHGLANGVSLDDKRFWPIFERAQALDVRSICTRRCRCRW
jgi:predicted TIM-barrel fold metal-dependent hydrolase